MTEAAARGQKWGWWERGSKRRRAGSTGSTAGRMPAATGAGLAGRFELFRFIGPWWQRWWTLAVQGSLWSAVNGRVVNRIQRDAGPNYFYCRCTQINADGEWRLTRSRGGGWGAQRGMKKAGQGGKNSTLALTLLWPLYDPFMTLLWPFYESYRRTRRRFRRLGRLVDHTLPRPWLAAPMSVGQSLGRSESEQSAYTCLICEADAKGRLWPNHGWNQGGRNPAAG